MNAKEANAKEANDRAAQTPAVLALETGGRRAALENDIAWHRQHLDEGWLSVNANGSLTTKAQLLALMGGTPFRFDSIEDSGRELHWFGPDLVAAVGVSERRRNTNGQAVRSRVRFCRTYRFAGDRWRLVLSQQTPIS